ncbi:MAG: proline racemase family protein [Planctomycetaceae bacterium]
MNDVQRIQVIDSHTGGEPTRVVIDGLPDLGPGSILDRSKVFGEQFDHIRSAIVNEPRGSDVIVGALLLESHEPDCETGVVYFNNAGVIGMCGHGTIGLMVTLKHLGRIEPGEYQLETTVGRVTATLLDDSHVRVRNVSSYRDKNNVEVDVPGIGKVKGDIAWGGNWFFLVSDHDEQIEANNVRRLSDVSIRIFEALRDQGIGGETGPVDHVELFAPPRSEENHSRNFVLCPGFAYDRSPCGTGTSAKLACLAADGKLAPGDVWRQESIIGSVFEASYEAAEEGGIYPTITGSAFVNGEATLLLNPADPFCAGIPS